MRRYRIIEISPILAAKQKAKLASRGHSLDMVEIVNKSIFDWDETVNEPCYFLAME
jgi:SAM-dependent MidA family methyltransferase